MSFGLYVHWPYCESKCPYCDFNSHVADRINPERWVEAYRQEIIRIAESTPDAVLTTIFFGGGTPSLMKPEVVAAVIDTARIAWRCSNDIEISMEANPGSVDIARFKAYRAAGVNRVSLGIQALDDGDLRRLGRMHSQQDALRAVEVAQAVFSRVSFDLMYGRQHQTVNDWRSELDLALKLGTGHLSLYQLTIEDGTVFGRRHALGQLPGLPGEDLSVDFFHATQELCDAVGMPAYEVSNHARPGEHCRHNLIYWTAGTYAAIGPGAHGRLGTGLERRATEAIRDPSAWLAAVERKGSGDQEVAGLSRSEQVSEALLMGLRLTDGVPLERLRDLGAQTDSWRSRGRLVDAGLLQPEPGVLRTTLQGRLLLNAVLGELSSDLRVDQT